MPVPELLTSLFDSVLVCDDAGVVVEAYGEELGIRNVLLHDALSPLYPHIRSCLEDGRPFETFFSPDETDRTRWRGQPHTLENGRQGLILAVEAPPPVDSLTPKLRIGGTAYEFVIANMRQGLWRLDAKGNIVYANPYLAAWLELPVESLIGEHYSQFLKAYEESGGRHQGEFITQTGLRRRAIVTSSPLYGPKGRPTGRIDLITDITAEHALKTKLVEEVQRMARLARTDPLTGLANRMMFDHALAELIAVAPSKPFAVVMVDLDYFKEINDSHGHSVGDKVLIEFAMRLQSGVRDTDIVVRLGGDEFAVLLVGASNEVASEVVSRLQERLNFLVETAAGAVPVSASLGWAHSDDGFEQIASVADRRMYQQKRQRKGA